MTACRRCGIFFQRVLWRKTMLKKTGFLTCITLFASVSLAQEDELSYRTIDLAPGLIMLQGQGGFTGGNLTLLTGDDGVVLIDNGIEPIAAMTIEAVERLTPAPVDFVINTHAHGDHTGANAGLHERGATIVAHEKLREKMVADNAARAAIPELTYTDSVTFHLNGIRAHVFHTPAAHTSGDSVIHFPEVNVIHAGDVLFNRLFPYVDLDGGGSLAGFIEAQRLVISLANDETKIVSGHGDLATRADVQTAVDMLIDAQARIQALVDAGNDLEAIKAADPLADYRAVWDWGFIDADRLSEMIYRSLAAAD